MSRGPHTALESYLLTNIVTTPTTAEELRRQPEAEQGLLQIMESCPLAQHAYPEVVILEERTMLVTAGLLDSCLPEHHRGVVHGITVAAELQNGLMGFRQSAGGDDLRGIS